MNRSGTSAAANMQAQFCLRFQRHLHSLPVDCCESLAKSFGPAWERALEEVPLEDDDQAKVYWELIQQAQRSQLFTARA